MPISVAIKYTWAREKTFEHLARAGELGAYLRKRWEDHGGPGAERWTMWDVALLQAFLKPDQASEVAVLTPPENTRRGVWYTMILTPSPWSAIFGGGWLSDVVSSSLTSSVLSVLETLRSSIFRG